MRAGKHVYVEKPLAHNLWENRKLAKIAKETGVATQMGNMGHSSEGIRQVVELLRAGAIGEVKESHSWCHATRWTNGLTGLPLGTSVKPVGFDWDLWLGPREEMPYHKEYTPVTWRDFWRFGCGAIGDFACHDMDATVWAYDLKEPETVQIYPIGQSDHEIAPFGEIGYFEFKAKGKQKDMKITWYADPGAPPTTKLSPKISALKARIAIRRNQRNHSMRWSRGRTSHISSGIESLCQASRKTIRRTGGHHRDWIDAIKGGPAASSNFEYASRLTEIALLGVLSVRMGGAMIRWDAENMKAIGLPEADQYIKERPSAQDGKYRSS